MKTERLFITAVFQDKKYLQEFEKIVKKSFKEKAPKVTDFIKIQEDVGGNYWVLLEGVDKGEVFNSGKIYKIEIVISRDLRTVSLVDPKTGEIIQRRIH